jgi:hypothetical protein
MVPIETVAQGAMVASRHDALWSDAPQRVDNTFGRTAPRYRVLRTEFESIRLTDEHPLWVQGKGWTAAQDLTDEDVLASAHGDALVLENTPVAQPLRVYNFSVDQTHNYFVGASGLWAHNAKCELTRTADIQNTTYKLLDRAQKGFKGELVVREALEAKGYTVIKAVGKHDGAYDAWKGKGGIDGIYKDKDGNYVIVESKATGGVKPSDPEGCVAGLCKLKGGERQMSREWIETRIRADDSLSKAEQDLIIDGFENGKTKRIYAQTDDKGTTFHEVIDRNGFKNDAEIGTELWNQ